jgi:hypothetical protein
MLALRPARSKRGETTSLTITPIITLILMMALILLPLLKYTMDIGTKTHFDRVYISRDLAGVINTVVGTPNNLRIYYPQNIFGMIVELNGDELYLKESQDQLHPLKTASAIFRMQNQNLVFDRIISEKDRKVCRILKQSNTVRGGEYVGPLDEIYYIPIKLESESLAFEISNEGMRTKRMYDSLNTMLFSEPSPDYVLKIHIKNYKDNQNNNGMGIEIPRGDERMAVLAANIANSIAGLGFNTMTRLDPIYISYSNDLRMVISLGNPDITKDNFMDDDTYMIMILSAIKNGIEDSYMHKDNTKE